MAVVVVVLVAVTAATSLAATRIRSRDQAAADRAPPPRSVLTAEVESRVLVDTLVVRASVTTEATVAVPVPDLPAGSRPTVTAAPAEPDAELAEGSVAFEVAGRPVLVLVGPIPVYRPLVPGDTGADVAQLQAAMARLGYDVDDDRAGTYGRGTAGAVGALFTDRGYAAIPHTVGDRSDAEAALAEAQAAFDGSEAAQHSIDAAVAAVRAVEAGSGPSIPFGEIVYVPTVPARLAAAPAIGSTAAEALGQLRVGRIRLEARLGVLEADDVAVDQAATAHDDASGAIIDATVASIGATETDPDSGEAFRRAVLEPVTPIDPALLGRDLRLTVEGTSTDAAVLVVPLVAVTNGPEGDPRVERQAGDRVESVPVTVGQSADGFVEVAGDLAPGDRVVVGR